MRNIEKEHFLEEFKKSYPSSRFLFACGSCFNLKPPVIVELGKSSECTWCFGKKDNIFLHELRYLDKDQVEYDVVRKRQSLSEYANEMCKFNLGLKWKPCTHGDKCNFAHSKIELEVWKLKSKCKISREKLAQFFQTNLLNNRDTLKGVFHCFVCSKNLPNGKEFSEHCDSIAHKKLMTTTEGEIWKFRPLPCGSDGQFRICSMAEKDLRCENKDACPYAHSEKELEEWKKRYKLQQEKLRCASQSGLMSFADKIYQEYQEASSFAAVFKDSLSGIKVVLNKKNKQQTTLKDNIVWSLTIKCSNPEKKLNHVAFVKLSTLYEKLFVICGVRGSRKSDSKEHIDFTASLDDGDSMNLHKGRAKFEVKFKPQAYGRFFGYLALEFRNSKRPVLLVSFDVDVKEKIDLEQVSFASNKDEKIISWERSREIIPWEPSFRTNYDEVLVKLTKKYKPPKAALEYPAESEAFRPDKLTVDNYVEEMHKFLYREENARSERLSKPRPFDVAMTENYVSSNKGLCLAQSGKLFAIFVLPSYLDRDTDEGLLILDSCTKVLIGRRASPQSPVYEILIEEKFNDHIILLFSERCIKDWNLETGDVFAAEIQFQLNRERFCVCHCAVDQLKAQNKLALVCPEAHAVRRRSHRNYQNYPSLDRDQNSVLKFMDFDDNSPNGDMLPLFVVQGSFGTGKTHTIRHCVMHLFENKQDAKILICTHTNSAANIYIENNFRDVEKWKKHVVRIVFHDRRPSTVSEHERNYCLWREDNRGFRYPTAQDVASHRIFITTFETALALGVEGTGLIGSFTHIFLDEAAQVMEAAAIIPLTLADSKKTKVLIAGDHKQMTEKIYSKDQGRVSGDAVLTDSNFTLLQRIFMIYSKNHNWSGRGNNFSFDDSNLVVLRNNYRCVAPILRLIEVLFYAEGLLNPCSNEQLLGGFLPIQFHDVQGKCEKNPLSSGYYNNHEANKCVEIVGNLLRDHSSRLQEKDIIVVASYNEQVALLRQALRRRNLHGVSASRVRNIQGLEYKVVVLSCVHRRWSKSDVEGKNYGLLSDANLLNTAFTRSKLAIIAVGHAATLCSLGKCSVMWKKYIMFCEQCRSLHPQFITMASINNEIVNFSALNPAAFAFIPGAGIAQSQNIGEGNQSNSPDNTSTVSNDDDGSDNEENLPLKDEILDDIIKNSMGYNPDKMIIKVDSQGREYASNRSDDEKDSGKKRIYSSFSHDQLKERLLSEPESYKRCRIIMTSWYSAEAIVLDPNSDIPKIMISTKVGLGQSFDQDEVVVFVTKIVPNPMKTEKQSKPNETIEETIAFGKVIGVLSRFQDPREKKFICTPDRTSPNFMCPIDKKITKFLILKPGHKKENYREGSVPICKVTPDGKVVSDQFVSYDIHSTSEDSCHFIVRYLKWPLHSKYPVGYVSGAIKTKNFEKYYSLIYDVPTDHKKYVDKEAEAIAKEDQSSKSSRVDLTHLYVFTIDPKGSKDLDDALSLEKCKDHKDCWKIGVHISDVASVVPAGSDVDLEAQHRVITYYSGDINENRKVTPMLPRALSANKCSLLADGNNKLAISTFFHSACLPDICPSVPGSNPERNIPSPSLTVIRSRRQMDYEEAEAHLREVRQRGVKNFETATADNLPDQLYIIWRIMLNLRRKRLDSAMFDSQPDFNKIKDFYKETTSHMLIEECMITLNACTALFLKGKGCDFFLRTQMAPSPYDCEIWKKGHCDFIKLSLFQQSCLQNLSRQPLAVENDQPSTKSQSPVPIYPQVWAEIEDAIDRNDVESALLLFSSDILQPGVCSGYSKYRSIQERAEVKSSSELQGESSSHSCTHYSLRLPLYAWSSSPIRRYPDIAVQRLLVEKCAQTQQSSQDPNVVVLEHRGQVASSILSKTISRSILNAREYEKCTRNVSFARSLVTRQVYQQAHVTEIDEMGMKLEFLDLKSLPLSAYLLKFNELKLLTQKPTRLVWRIRYYDLAMNDDLHNNDQAGALAVRQNFKSLVSTSVTMATWQSLVKAIKEVTSDSSFSLSGNQERLIKLFEEALDSRKESVSCQRRLAKGGPCNNDECRKKQANCKDVLCHKSKTGFFHYRKITMSLRLGMPTSVQLHCDVKRGICSPSIQTLALAEDFDICLSHSRSPIEIFASEVRPCKRHNFADLQAYKNHWMPLFRMDGIYNAAKDNNNSITLKNVEVTFYYSKTHKLKGKFTLDSKYCYHRLIDVYQDDFLCMRIQKCYARDDGSDECSTWVGHALVLSMRRIDSTSGEKLRIKLRMCAPRVSSPKPPDDDINKSHLATVEVIKLGISHRLIANALKKVDSENFKNEEVLSSLCLDHRIPRFEHTDAVNEVCNSVGTKTVAGMKYNLNEVQIKQIRNALESKISMIQGPPGTGKSFVGAHLTYYFGQLNMAKNGNRGKILYCGPSNKSVDVVAKYLINSSVKVLRVYGTNHEEQDFPNPLKPALPLQQVEKRPDKDIKSISLHHKIRSRENPYANEITSYDAQFKTTNHVSPEDFKDYKKLVIKAKVHEIYNHDVIIATCVTSSNIMRVLERYSEDQQKHKKSKKAKKKFKNVIFTQCIIDECGMCSEPETLAPIIVSEADQVVLIGDHTQLQPIIMCDRAKEFGLGVSMFERLNKRAGMLTRQYRMNPGICQFPSDQFYDKKLITDESVIQREKGKTFDFCYPPYNPKNTAIFCHIVGEEKSNYSLERGGENSNFNLLEARAVIKILVYLHVQNRVPLAKIMILSPYTAQVHTIKKILEEERSQMKEVHVGTVVTSQGNESDYVILSTVRSQPDYAIEEEASLHWRRKYLGFITDPHQINVAITRAKSGLCIVGNGNLLSKDTDTWKKLLDSYSARGSVVNFDDPNAPWNSSH